MYKSISEVVARLAQAYSGPTYKREGPGGKEFTYIPWTVTKRLLDDVFGVFGWTTSAPHSYYANHVFVSEFGLTVRVTDDEGNLIEKTVPCQGMSNVLIDRNGNERADDNAVKSARSDALSSGAKLLGDVFGFTLYEHKDAEAASTRPASNGNGARAATSTSKGSGPSDKQRKFLNDLGWPDSDIAGMGFARWKGILENREHNSAAAEPDEIPF